MTFVTSVFSTRFRSRPSGDVDGARPSPNGAVSLLDRVSGSTPQINTGGLVPSVSISNGSTPVKAVSVRTASTGAADIAARTPWYWAGITADEVVLHVETDPPDAGQVLAAGEGAGDIAIVVVGGGRQRKVLHAGGRDGVGEPAAGEHPHPVAGIDEMAADGDHRCDVPVDRAGAEQDRTHFTLLWMGTAIHARTPLG